MCEKDQYGLSLGKWEEVIAITRGLVSSIDRNNWLVNVLALKAAHKHLSVIGLSSFIDGQEMNDRDPLSFSTVEEFEEITKESIDIIEVRLLREGY